MRVSRLPRISLMLCGLLTAAIALATGGCAIFGFGAYVLNPPTVEAQYVPPKTLMVVAVENRRNPGMVTPETDQLVGYIREDLVAHEVAPLVDREKIDALRDRFKDPADYRKMSIQAMGKAVGAEQVLYVDLVRISFGSQPGMTNTSQVEMYVHVVDVKTGQTVWPKGAQQNTPVIFQAKPMDEITVDNFSSMQASFLRGAALQVSRLFYTWHPEES